MREKEVRDAEICPERAGVVALEGRLENATRSVRIDVDCLRAELKIVF